MRVIVQKALLAGSLNDIYVSDDFKLITGIIVCNRSAATVNFRLSFAEVGSADNAGQYVFYDTPILPNDTFISGLEIGIAPKDIIRAYASSDALSITITCEEWS